MSPVARFFRWPSPLSILRFETKNDLFGHIMENSRLIPFEDSYQDTGNLVCVKHDNSYSLFRELPKKFV